jgi:hypothetical protein
MSSPSHAEDLAPFDTGALAMDVCHETRRAIVDLIRGDEPTTILGLLLRHTDGITLQAIADGLRRPVGEIGWRVSKLEEEELCMQVVRGGITRVLPFAPYTARNE